MRVEFSSKKQVIPKKWPKHRAHLFKEMMFFTRRSQVTVRKKWLENKIKNPAKKMDYLII